MGLEIVYWESLEVVYTKREREWLDRGSGF